ncbi:hypothetical protein B5E41_09170 [Rhizobium esperanzae]|uniref:Uncharacterized protein n=2 Tax=Rhizobium esperanzae TaxID=1967781 RepID=A0A246DY27_9HYPH|nr:hypothetical protein B5E41_09170 [Rhizobium esperanzae]
MRAFRAENPKMRERDLAAQLKISEAALVAPAEPPIGIIIAAVGGPFLWILLRQRSRLVLWATW